MAILEEVKEGLSWASPIFPLLSTIRGGHSLSIYYGQPQDQVATKSHETHEDLTRRTASLPSPGFTLPYNMCCV